jgi:hypothetical protein
MKNSSSSEVFSYFSRDAVAWRVGAIFTWAVFFTFPYITAENFSANFLRAFNVILFSAGVGLTLRAVLCPFIRLKVREGSLRCSKSGFFSRQVFEIPVSQIQRVEAGGAPCELLQTSDVFVELGGGERVSVFRICGKDEVIDFAKMVSGTVSKAREHDAALSSQ